jgi:hypothetical protein
MCVYINSSKTFLLNSKDFIICFPSNVTSLSQTHSLHPEDGGSKVFRNVFQFCVALRRGFLRRRKNRNCVLKQEVHTKFRISHNEELGDLYSSLSAVRAVESKGLRWAGHVARIRKQICNTYTLWMTKPLASSQTDHRHVPVSIILKWILEKYSQHVDWHATSWR